MTSKASKSAMQAARDDGHDASSSAGGDGGEEHSSSNAGTQEENDKQKNAETSPGLAHSETKAVRNLRILVLLVLLSVSATASVCIYFFTRRSEENEFESEFHGQGLKVIESFQEEAFQMMQTLDSLSTSLTTYAIDRNLTWPFVTIGNIAHFLNPYLSLADASALVILPIVTSDEREKWEEYSRANTGWIDDALGSTKQQNEATTRNLLTDHSAHQKIQNRHLQYSATDVVSPYIKSNVGVETSTGPWTVWWQYAPVIDNLWFINFNRGGSEGFSEIFESAMNGKAALSPPIAFEPGLDLQSTRDFEFISDLLAARNKNSRYGPGEPLSYASYPVFGTFDDRKDAPSTAVIMATMYWKSYFQGVLPDNIVGVYCVVEDSVGQVFTYRIDGEQATFLGMEDLHDSSFDKYELSGTYQSFLNDDGDGRIQYTGVEVDDSRVSYTIRVYPSSDLEDEYLTTNPIIYTFVMLSIMMFTSLVFITYDWFVERRQKLVYTTAVKSSAVVSSLFPESVKDRVIDHAGGKVEANPKRRGFLSQASSSGAEDKASTPPIADFFPSTTIMFADIRGFTAWCSQREPVQVFTLLETVYGRFDAIAKKRGVFKVETVGDCYVAVSGLPKPKKKHAVVMAKFANDILVDLRTVVHELEVSLGPGTGDLDMRVGLHSGAVTGGVVRGDNARFQLFGDTMNTAARMESTGKPGRIQISQETARELSSFGKDSWFKAREEKVIVKGKGELQTYWLMLDDDAESVSTSENSNDLQWNADIAQFEQQENSMTLAERKIARLVDWNTEILSNLLKQVIHRRNIITGERSMKKKQSLKIVGSGMGKTVLDDVKEIITMPKYEATKSKDKAWQAVDLGDEVEKQMRLYVTEIASLYKDVPFHNFEHASHVAMSVVKLLSRIVAPKIRHTDGQDLEQRRHDHTYGITSDPLTQFACVFSALIHDVGHTGVPNTQLAVENPELAAFYKNKSIAEQNSVDVAFNVLMQGSFDELRSAIFQTQDELDRFRMLVVNSVMATDIIDKDLKQLRNNRWDKAFQSSDDDSQNKEAVDRKATIVIEHLIQASDIAHTMQHWHVYRKWNQCLFEEMYEAFRDGRAAKDPAEFWYKGEIGFFDFYIIPLAKKLKDCGVFGVSSSEYLDYALSNRQEWENRGEEVVMELMESAKASYETRKKEKLEAASSR